MAKTCITQPQIDRFPDPLGVTHGKGLSLVRVDKAKRAGR
jgi:hypothetical protein